MADPLQGMYNPWLVAISVIIAIAASYAALDLAGRVSAARGAARIAWFGGGSLAMGTGIWAMHYIGMLAYSLPVEVRYDWPAVLVSLAAAVLASAVALFVVSRPRLGVPAIALGGALMGAGIASMHYIGMAAMRLPAICGYSPGLVALSVLLAVVISMVALWLAFQFRGATTSGGWRKFGSAVLMGAAIPTMHYTGMAAVTFVPLNFVPDYTRTLAISSLGMAAIIVVTTIVLAIAIGTSLIDRRFSAQASALNRSEQSLTVAEERTRQHAARLDALWQITNNPTLRGQELIHAMLREAATVIRRTQRFRGVLSRIEGGELVVVGLGVETDDDPHVPFFQIGQRVPIEITLLSRSRRSQGWDDFAILSDIPEGVTLLGWRAAIVTQFDAGDSRYSLAFASLEPTTIAFGTEDFAYLEMLASSFAKQLQVNRLEDSLRDEDARARQHAERLEALWKIVNDPTLREVDLWLAMLGQAATDIRPGQSFQGSLWRVQDTDMVLEAIAAPPDYGIAAFSPKIGTTVPLEITILGKILADGLGTRSWDDIQSSAVLNEMARKYDLRSFIMTTFTAGGATWALAFASGQTTSAPLGPSDHAYIEVLASFFANHVQQRWQFNRIQYQQSHDALTGLLNRSQFRSQARAASSAYDRYAVILLDVNAFREINESYGHMIGDALLVEVGSALQQRVSGDETIGRVAGDVFGIYIANPISREFVRARALDFAEVFARAFSTGDREGKEFIALTASLGVALAPDDGATLDAILSHADTALFIAKERGHGSMVFYETGMEGDAQRRAAFRNELNEAIAEDQFTLYYQPHVELSTGAVAGCEALIRWNHPTRGLLLPSHFIPFAEETGIITSIDTWVMRNAFAAAAELAALRPGFRLYFNLSGRQAGNPNLIRLFTAAARDGVALRNIGVEITESDAMRDVEATRHVCRALRRLNVRIAIDDFGTGYSSLSSLKRLPVDIVKIDQSFISGILSDPDDEAIAETIIAISTHFGFESLAEGAEQPAEVEWLRQRGCRYVQGFAISPSLPLDDFKSWVSARDG